MRKSCREINILIKFDRRMFFFIKFDLQMFFIKFDLRMFVDQIWPARVWHSEVWWLRSRLTLQWITRPERMHSWAICGLACFVQTFHFSLSYCCDLTVLIFRNILTSVLRRGWGPTEKIGIRQKQPEHFVQSSQKTVGRVKMDYRGPAFDQSGWLRWCKPAGRWNGCFSAFSEVLRLGRFFGVVPGRE